MTIAISDRPVCPAVAAWLVGIIACDIPQCPSTCPGGWGVAVDAGWRTDTSRLRRCPDCLTIPWPGPADGPTPPAAAYQAHHRGNPAKLTAWLDRKYGPLQPVVPTVAHDDPAPDFPEPAVWELDPAVEAKVAAFEAAHDAEDGTNGQRDG